MKPIIRLVLAVIVISILSACQSLALATPAPSSTFVVITPTPLPPTPTPQPTATPEPTLLPSATPDACPNGDCITACFLKLAPIANPADLKARRSSRSIEVEDGFRLVSYAVNGDQIDNPVDGSNFPDWLKPFQQDRAAQRQVWDYFAALIPLEQRKYLSEYHVISDGEDNTLAMVTQTETDMNSWALEVDIFDTANAQDLTDTLIHEFSHLLSLNPSQVPASKRIFDNPDDYDIYDGEAYACKTYFPGEGCSLPESYINQFYQRFWKKIQPEWTALDELESDDDYYAALDRLYIKYQDQFVSDYAATDTSEDFAEVFTVFILEPKPNADTIADQKVLFFYEFPELVSLRGQIGHNLCTRVAK